MCKQRVSSVYSARRGNSAAPLLLLALVLTWQGAFAAEGTKGLRAEAFVSDANPYIEQTIVYTLRVYHGTDVAEINPEPITGHGFSLEKIDAPPKTTRVVGRGGRMVSDFRYALTPLSEGRLEVPAVRIAIVSHGRSSAQRTGYQPTRQEIELHVQSVVLKARPQVKLDEPWLPLYGLRIAASFDRRETPRVGEPLSLTLVQTAWGADGDRLPSLAPLLQFPDFKVYAGQTETSRVLAANGRGIQGRRAESFTLIPQRAGQVNIPPLQISWWNLDRHRKASSQWPGISLQVQRSLGAPDLPTATAAAANSGGHPVLWAILLVSAASFALGWWLRSGFVVEIRRARAVYQTLSGKLLTRLRRWPALRALDRFAARLWEQLAPLRPAWLETWLLRRRMTADTDPQALERDLQAYAHRALDLPLNTSLFSIGQALVEIYPRINEPRLRELLGRLNASLYGGAEPVVLVEWVRDFKRVLRTAGPHRTQLRDRTAHQTLPVLNP